MSYTLVYCAYLGSCYVQNLKLYNVNGWISCSRMWEVVKHVFIIPLGVQKGLPTSWKRNRKRYALERTGKHSSMSTENQWSKSGLSLKMNKVKMDHFLPSLIFTAHWIVFACFLVVLFLLFSFFSFTFVFYFKLWLFWDRLWWRNFSSIRPFLLTWIYLDIILTFHTFLVVFFWRIFCKYFLYFDMSDFYGWKLFL